jgi:hypothetical protein
MNWSQSVRSFGRSRRRVLAGALALALVAVGTAAAITTRATVAPSNTGLPTTGGVNTVGSTLTANPGTWNGSTPITFAYQWEICDTNGAACHDISGATSNTYVLKADDAGNTVRIRVTAKNSGGTTSATSAASAVIASGGGSTGSGCPSPPAGTTTVDVKNVQPPARLQVAKFQLTSGAITLKTTTFSARFVITDTCNQPVSGALVYVTAVPYNQFTIPTEKATDASGAVTLTFNRMALFPASTQQQQLTMFARARRDGDDLLAGISTRRLIAFSIKR